MLTVAFSVSSWASGSRDQVIAATFPSWSQYLWHGGLIMGAVLALVGLALHTVAGLLVERGARFWLAGLYGCYGVEFLAFAGRADLGHAVYVVVLVNAYALVWTGSAGQYATSSTSPRRSTAAVSVYGCSTRASTRPPQAQRPAGHAGPADARLRRAHRVRHRRDLRRDPANDLRALEVDSASTNT